jgi:hypothetical protein
VSHFRRGDGVPQPSFAPMARRNNTAGRPSFPRVVRQLPNESGWAHGTAEFASSETQGSCDSASP